MRSYVWVVLGFLCTLGLVARAEVAVTTADGIGADTYLTNDGQEGAGTTHGTDVRIRAFRAFAGTRMKIGYVRWDLTGISDPNAVTISFDATYLKGGSKSVTVYGLNDGPGDYWDEASTSYNTAPGFIPNPPTAEAQYAFVEGAVTELGTISTPSADIAAPLSFTESVVPTATSTPIEDFLANDLNGIVTLIFIGSDNEVEVASKERTDGLLPPTLTFPNSYAVNRASSPVPADYSIATTTQYTQLSWTAAEPNTVGGAVTYDVYFGTEPNVLLPNFGLTLIAEGISDTFATMPTLDTYQTYYWKVDTHDATRAPLPEFVAGKVWSFNTNNSAPVVDAGEDQYAWLTRAVVNTTSSNDTYLRDTDTSRGSQEFMDVRGGGNDFVSYLQFNLSDLTAMGPGVLSNATLTLTKVAGSRNDTITNGRFSLHGLNNVAGNTPQNWSETVLMDTNVGAEFAQVVPIDLTSGRLTDLDDNVAGISEVITNGTTITISGAALEAFLQSRVDDNGLVTFVIACEDGSDRGYGIATKENSDPAIRPNLTLNFVPNSATNNGDALVTLNGSYTDDGLPAGTETIQWTEVSRPEGADPVVISPDNTVTTAVSLATVGFYEFQLTVNDTDLVGTDTVQIYVGTDPCDAAQNMPTYSQITSDFNNDCFVTLEDFAFFASQWLDCSSLVCPF